MSFLVHVRSCNDNGRRIWVNKIEKYFGKDEFLLKHPNGASSFKRSKRLSLISGIEQFKKPIIGYP